MSRGTRENCKRDTEPFAYGAITLYGGLFQKLSARQVFCNSSAHPQMHHTASHNPARATPAGYHTRAVWAVPCSLAATDGITDLFYLPGGTEMVHFPPLPSLDYVFIERYSGMSQSGFPHSEIPGSKPACGSPRLIAAYRVLHRLSAPRHPPCTLSSLTKLECKSIGESYRL